MAKLETEKGKKLDLVIITMLIVSFIKNFHLSPVAVPLSPVAVPLSPVAVPLSPVAVRLSPVAVPFYTFTQILVRYYQRMEEGHSYNCRITCFPLYRNFLCITRCDI